MIFENLNMPSAQLWLPWSGDITSAHTFWHKGESIQICLTCTQFAKLQACKSY